MNSYNNQHSSRSFQRIARAIASKAKLSVEFGGNRAYTDGRMMHLPAIETHEDQDVILGYVCHEAGHVRSTDFSIKNEKFINIFEDHRIERFMASQLGGAEDLIIKTWKHLYKDAEPNPESKYSAFSAVCNYLICKGQDITMNRQSVVTVMQAITEHATTKLIEHWGDITLELDGFLMRSKNTSSTMDVKKLSDELSEFLENLSEPESDDDESESEGDESESDGDDESESDGDESESDGDDESESEGDESESDGDESESDGDESESDGDESESDGDESESDGDDESDDDALTKEQMQSSKDDLRSAFDNGETAPDLSDMLDQLIQEIIDESIAEHGSASSLMESNIVNPEDLPIPNIDIQRNAELLSGSIAQTIKVLIEAKSRTKRQTKRRGQRIDNTRLSRVAVGDSRIFERRSEKDGIDTAVTIAVDKSGSMNGERLNTALAAAIGITHAIQVTKGASARQIIFPGIGRYDAVAQVTPRGEIPNISISGITASGGTPLLQAIADSALELETQTAKKKVIICITDGSVDSETANDVLDITKQNGIEIFWVAISVDMNYFPFEENVIHVNNPEEISDAFLNHAKEMF